MILQGRRGLSKYIIEGHQKQGDLELCGTRFSAEATAADDEALMNTHRM